MPDLGLKVPVCNLNYLLLNIIDKFFLSLPQTINFGFLISDDLNKRIR